MNIKIVRLTYVVIQILQISVIFTHLKVLVATARHMFKWGNN